VRNRSDKDPGDQGCPNVVADTTCEEVEGSGDAEGGSEAREE